MWHRGQVHSCFGIFLFSFPSTDPAFSGTITTDICVQLIIGMAERTHDLIRLVVSATLNNVPHVVGLCATFQMVRVATPGVVAFVSYDGGPFQCGDVMGESMDGTVFSVGVELAVAVTPA